MSNITPFITLHPFHLQDFVRSALDVKGWRNIGNALPYQGLAV
jgi:hypothetical protein